MKAYIKGYYQVWRLVQILEKMFLINLLNGIKTFLKWMQTIQLEHSYMVIAHIQFLLIFLLSHLILTFQQKFLISRHFLMRI